MILCKETKKGMRNFVIGCDSAAVKLKEILKEDLLEMGYSVEDVGCHSSEDKTNYPLIAEKVVNRIIDSGYSKRGVLVCGTGLGMAICANKFPGIRAGVCHDSYSGARLVLSNDGNVICFGERVVGAELAKTVLREFVRLEFKDGPSTPKIEDIKAIDAQNMVRRSDKK